MSSDSDAVRLCLRAFADAQATQFLSLWGKLSQRAGRPIPPIQFHIYPSDVGRDAAYVVLAAEASRTDGLQITWSVRLNASPERLEVSGGIEVTDDDGSREVFGRTETTTNSAQAAEFLARLSAEVCAQDGYLERPTGSRAA